MALPGFTRRIEEEFPTTDPARLRPDQLSEVAKQDSFGNAAKKAIGAFLSP
jgi:hypothetical protein